MSALPRIRCAGAPRDLGLDQGRALAAVIGAREAGRIVRHAREVACDLGRFFPHHEERTQGISLGARVSEAALVDWLAAQLAGEGGIAVAAGGLLARTLTAPPATLVLRESAPDNDYASLEIVWAGSAAAWIGVNEHGLAATAVAAPATPDSLDGCAAPALLLVQDVLQRFDVVEKAVEWLLRRPAGGCASVLVADGAGRSAEVQIAGRSRRVLDAPLLAAGAPAARARLEKAAVNEPRLDAASLARLVAEASSPPRLVALADPAVRRIGIASHAGAIEWSGVGTVVGQLPKA